MCCRLPRSAAISRTADPATKVRRIRELIPDVEEFETYAYGDTKGDLPMLEFAKHSEFRPFRTEN